MLCSAPGAANIRRRLPEKRTMFGAMRDGCDTYISAR
eukprot:gene2563-7189_t